MWKKEICIFYSSLFILSYEDPQEELEKEALYTHKPNCWTKCQKSGLNWCHLKIQPKSVFKTFFSYKLKTNKQNKKTREAFLQENTSVIAPQKKGECDSQWMNVYVEWVKRNHITDEV